MNEEELKKRLDWYEKKYGAYFEKRGIHNVKNLFRMPNSYEWLILTILIFALFMSYTYGIETKTCREALGNIETTACQVCSLQEEIKEMNSVRSDSILKNVSDSIIVLSNLTQNQRGTMNE